MRIYPQYTGFELVVKYALDQRRLDEINFPRHKARIKKKMIQYKPMETSQLKKFKYNLSKSYVTFDMVRDALRNDPDMNIQILVFHIANRPEMQGVSLDYIVDIIEELFKEFPDGMYI